MIIYFEDYFTVIIRQGYLNKIEQIDKAIFDINNNLDKMYIDKLKGILQEEDYTTEAFEKYSEWDNLGRSGVAYANICKKTMPKEGETRGEIGNIKDLSGWVQKRYDNLIKDKYLYNRCHLIGWQLSNILLKNNFYDKIAPRTRIPKLSA